MPRTIIGIVGLGVIGRRWAASFAHAGHDVRAFDPVYQGAKHHDLDMDQLYIELDELFGADRSRGSVSVFPTMAEALDGVGFVQENGPENLALKRKLLCEIESHVGEDVIIASSSSALLVSDMQLECQFPERIVPGHPFNPVHLMPLVEIVGGKETAPWATAAARQIYEDIGKKPVTLNREITGHLALRLMGAMWREAIALVRDGVASAEDVDRAFIFGPGPKWTLQGAFISNQLNAAGMDEFMQKYGPTYQAIWDTLLDAKLDEPTIAAVLASTTRAVAGRSQEQLRGERDAGLTPVLMAIRQHGAY
jgi:carnitine 3-dehydrogenase